MTYGEKAAATIFFVVGFFVGGLGGLTLGHDLTIKDLTAEKNHPITYLSNRNERKTNDLPRRQTSVPV